MKKYRIPVMMAGALAVAVSVAAQSQPSTSSAQTQPAAGAGGATVTVEGCLMREDDVPGRKANIAERAGMGEDFILTSTKMMKGSAPAARGSATSGAVGTSGTTSGAMYDINGIDDETLRRYVNRSVQVEGSFENLDAEGDELIEIRATSVRPGSGQCPPK